jgi:hypothetical protein
MKPSQICKYKTKKLINNLLIYFCHRWRTTAAGKSRNSGSSGPSGQPSDLHPQHHRGQPGGRVRGPAAAPISSAPIPLLWRTTSLAAEDGVPRVGLPARQCLLRCSMARGRVGLTVPVPVRRGHPAAGRGAPLHPQRIRSRSDLAF